MSDAAGTHREDERDYRYYQSTAPTHPFQPDLRLRPPSTNTAALFNQDTLFSPPIDFTSSFADDPPELDIDHALSAIFANQHEQSRQILRSSQTEDLQNLLGARSHPFFHPPYADEPVFGYFSTASEGDPEPQPYLEHTNIFGIPLRMQSPTPPPFSPFHQDTDFVDITSPSPPPPRRHSMDSQPQRNQKRTHSQVTSTTTTAEPSQKRRRPSNSQPTSHHGESSQSSNSTRRSSRPNPTTTEAITIDTIDLSSDNATTAPLANTLRKQREEAVLAQQSAPHHSHDDDKPLRFGTLSCIICMDKVTDITSTKCGHFFCHTCLMEALIAGENREGGRSQCPVCRTAVKRGKRDELVPLLLMKRPRREGLGKAKERAKV